MKACMAVVFAAFVLPAPGHQAPLPKWPAEEKPAFQDDGWIAGAALLTAGPETEGTQPPAHLVLAEPAAEEIVVAASPPEVPEEYWDVYFNQRPKNFLVDPQGVLHAKEFKDRLEFLNYHAGDSAIDLYVYVFPGDQVIPGEVGEEELMERFYNEGKPAVVVMHYHGAPERSKVWISPSLMGAVPLAERVRALESSVIQAFKHAGSAQQLDGFLVQLSIRVYWMERMLKGDVVPTLEAMSAMPGKKDTVNGESGLEEKFGPLLNIIASFGWPAGLALGLLAVGLLARRILRARATFRFPEIDVEPRLGGAHAAGVGAVISFANTAISPSSQRDQLPEYLRRM
ncbi:MAG: hypothetical protein V4733_12080 [Verrucomicrobiota bacterium]